MAIWQFRIDLIPERALHGKFGLVPVALPKELAEDYAWWNNCQPAVPFESALAALLPESPSWSSSMRLWGDERGDTASVCYSDNGSVQWIGFRVDVRDINPPFVEGICEFAKRMGCLLLTGQYHLLSPDIGLVLSEIRHSTAQRYLDNPAAKLRTLKRGEPEIIPFPEKTEGNNLPPKDE